MELGRRYPGIADLERAAPRRIPRFAWEYLAGGIGTGDCLSRNRTALESIRLLPRYLAGAAPDLSVELMGRKYALPFGVAPIGLSGLMWPRAPSILAAAARDADIPFVLSTYATDGLDEVARIAPEHAWFQLYPPNRPEIETDLIKKAKAAGYGTLVVTVDIPTRTKRDHDIRNGLSVPPRMDLRNFAQIAIRPRWALATLRAGIPRFRNLVPYAPPGASLAQLGLFLAGVMEGHVTAERLKAMRDRWPGKLVVKGVLDPADAAECRRIGADGIVVSNHGGRQLDAAPTAPEMLGAIRAAAGPGMAILADGGVRSGLDVARMLAAGADFVLAGRALMFGVAALGAAGGTHAIGILRDELGETMRQMGCPRIADLPRFRAP